MHFLHNVRSMNLTLEQARALDALARHGTFTAAARELAKAHTAVLYAVRTLEEQTGLTLLDRSGYRTRLTPEGERVLVHCRRLLEAERELLAACAELKTGWEPTVRIVFDGVYPAETILRAVGALREEGATTRFHVSADHLTGVEERFERESAELMISLLPPRGTGLTSIGLPAIPALLVAHRAHPLARARGSLREEDLAADLLLTVRGSDPRLQLRTEHLEQRATVVLNDFSAKKSALLQGLGFGWMPTYLIERELKRGELKVLKLEHGSTHAFQPRLHHRTQVRLGRATSQIIEALTEG